MQRLFFEAFIYSLFGLTIEVVFTGIWDAIESGFKTFKGSVSLLMAVPYFVGFILGTQSIIFFHIEHKLAWILFLIYALEYVFGSIYHYFGIRPWKYDHTLIVHGQEIRFDFHGTITLAYLPFWLIFAHMSLYMYSILKSI